MRLGPGRARGCARRWWEECEEGEGDVGTGEVVRGEDGSVSGWGGGQTMCLTGAEVDM